LSSWKESHAGREKVLAMSERNKAIIREMVESAFNQRDVAALDRFVAEDYVELDPMPGQEQGREGFKKLLAELLAAFPDMRWTFEEQIAEGDKVVSRFRWSATHAGDFAGIPATGKQVTVKGVVIDRVVDGLMVDSRILQDDLGMLRQLGVIPEGPS
jgi:steroid delta-isomerase-like uncharacterized protein